MTLTEFIEALRRDGHAVTVSQVQVASRTGRLGRFEHVGNYRVYTPGQVAKMAEYLAERNGRRRLPRVIRPLPADEPRCFADSAEQAESEHGLASREWFNAWRRRGTCLLSAGHEGAHHFTKQ